MVIDASSCFAAKMMANTLQRDVGNAWKVQCEYTADDDAPYDWYDIEFILVEKETGKRHEVPSSFFA